METESDDKASLLLDLKNKMKNYKDLMTVVQPKQAATMEDPKSVYTRFKDYMERDTQDVRKVEVPDFLKCAIADDIMKDPVIIQSGHTYEKAMIEKHFRMLGAFDPVTRQ